MSPIPIKNTEVVPTTPSTLSFPEAIQEVIDGKKITRLEWKDAGTYGFLNGDILSLHKNSDEKNYQWIVSDGDLMGKDWVLA